MKQPIGVFDSGIGGTTILKELVKEMPSEDFLYYADSANAPYGPKSKEEIIGLCCNIVDWLLNKGCKLIVVACNTATTNAISFLRQKYNVPFIGIEPAIKPAALHSKTQNIGVLATQGTLSSPLFHKTMLSHASHVKIHEVVGKGLVEYMEKGDFKSDNLKKLLSSYVIPLINQKIDYLVLGCTHYPYLKPLLKELLPSEISIIDSGEAVAKQTLKILNEKHLICENDNIDGKIYFFGNGSTKILKKIQKIHFVDTFGCFIDILR